MRVLVVAVQVSTQTSIGLKVHGSVLDVTTVALQLVSIRVQQVRTVVA